MERDETRASLTPDSECLSTGAFTLLRVTNINHAVFDEPREHPGFRYLRARLSRQAGSDRLGLSLWELPAGETDYPRATQPESPAGFGLQLRGLLGVAEPGLALVGDRQRGGG